MDIETYDELHVLVGREEAADAVGRNGGRFNEQLPVVAYHCRILAKFEAGGDRYLITPAAHTDMNTLE